MEEVDIRQLIKEIAATGADPQWVAEAIAIEQEVAEAKRSEAVTAAGSRRTRTGQLLLLRPQLRVVATGPE